MKAIASGPLVAGLVRAFHPVALTCASVVIVTGLVASWLRLPTVASLWESSYGRVLLVKLAFVAIVVVMGAFNWRRMMPSLGDDQSARRGGLRRPRRDVLAATRNQGSRTIC